MMGQCKKTSRKQISQNQIICVVRHGTIHSVNNMMTIRFVTKM